MDDLDTTDKYAERHTELVKIIESFESLEKSEEWLTLKELVFDKALRSIERQMLNICTSKDIDLNKLYHLQGEWTWAKQYCEINKFIETIKKQLKEIKTKI